MKQLAYGVRELQANLGKALRAVERGDQVVITSHGRPIAVLAHVDSSVPSEPVLARKRKRLASEGRILLGDSSPIPDYQAPPGDGLSAQVLADRR